MAENAVLRDGCSSFEVRQFGSVEVHLILCTLIRNIVSSFCLCHYVDHPTVACFLECRLGRTHCEQKQKSIRRNDVLSSLIIFTVHTPWLHLFHHNVFLCVKLNVILLHR
jgi:hypothetical protein